VQLDLVGLDLRNVQLEPAIVDDPHALEPGAKRSVDLPWNLRREIGVPFLRVVDFAGEMVAVEVVLLDRRSTVEQRAEKRHHHKHRSRITEKRRPKAPLFARRTYS
jgi:hypothetical protein